MRHPSNDIDSIVPRQLMVQWSIESTRVSDGIEDRQRTGKKEKLKLKQSMIKLKAKSFNILCYNLLFPPVKVLFSLAGATDLFQVAAPEDELDPNIK